MKRILTLALLTTLWPAIALAQISIVDYRGVDVQSPDPTGAGGLRFQSNFKTLADRIGSHFEVAGDPDTDDDSADTGGNGASMTLSTWHNTVDDGLFACLDASEGAAVWVEVTNDGIDWSSVAITGGTINGTTIGASSATTGQFTTIGAGGVGAADYPLTMRQTVDSQGFRVYGFDDQSAAYADYGISSFGTGVFSASGQLTLLSGSTLNVQSASTLNMKGDGGAAVASLNTGGFSVDVPTYGVERSSDATEPAEGKYVIWMSDGTAYGDDGDVCIASQAGGVTKKAILFDHSAGAGW